MTASLESLATCFQGILPAQLFTCSSDGTPNAAYISHVEYVDAEHVALSFQFFNKSRRNIAENPQASVMVTDPDTGQGWTLHLAYIRSEAAGPLFARMALRIEAIATYSGLKGVFRLRAADVYRVLAIERAPEEASRADVGLAPDTAPTVFTPRAVRDLVRRLEHAESLEGLVDCILAGVERDLGFRHSSMLLPTEQDGVLATVATRGYAQQSVGAEVRYGEGIGGMVAEARAPIRIHGLVRGMLYALAMHNRPTEPEVVARTRQIPLAALENPDSQLGVPLLVRGELVGVLCLESERPYRFHEDDKVCVELLGTCLGLVVQQMQSQERMLSDAVDVGVPPVAPTTAPHTDRSRRLHLAFHVADECMLLDDEYLIRGLPARILKRLVQVREATGRHEFSNRELRLDKSLNLPGWKDNLESRLILLRRRLEQKCPAMRLAPRGRGRFALEVDGVVVLDER